MVTTTHQYYQYLFVRRDGEATQLPNGSWQTSEDGWELVAACREETNGKGATIVTANGEARVFGSLIQLPKGTARINEGTAIAVLREAVDATRLSEADFIEASKITGLVVATGTCEKFDLGRLHCRLWI
jgi:ADP-ribose pyrophosphatase YjhB (NUDIX family)